MVSRHRTSWATLVGLLAIAHLVSTPEVQAKRRADARPNKKKGKQEEKGNFWERISEKEKNTPAQAEERILKILRSSIAAKQPSKRKKLLKKAVAEARKWSNKHPKSANIHYWLGFTLYQLKDYKASLVALKKALKLDPKHKYRSDISFKLGIIYTTQLEFLKAYKTYKDALATTTRNESKGVIYSNAAECLMGLGRIREAIRAYQNSLAVKPGKNSQALWGLAVALDRDEQIIKAKQAAKAAVRLDPKLTHIQGEGIFFVPKGEQHYYLAMAQEALGNMATALRHWKAFAKALPKSPWSYRARDHIKKLLPLRKKAQPDVQLQKGQAVTMNNSVVTGKKKDRLLKKALPTLKACYKKRVKSAPVPEGHAVVELVTDARHKILKVSWGDGTASTIQDKSLLKCIRKKLKGRALSRGPMARTPKQSLALKVRFFLNW